MDNIGKNLANKEILKGISILMKERMSEAEKMLDDSKPISSVTRYINKKIIALRIRLFYFVIFITIYSLFNLAHSMPFGIVFSIISLIGGISLIILIFMEVFRGAGSQIETEYICNGDFMRSFKFIPSFNNLSKLILFISFSFLYIIVGFSGVYLELSRINNKFFNVLLDGFSSVYFSIVTFATVGFGDIYPTHHISRMIAASEILLAIFLVSIVLATTISWVTTNERERYEEYLKTRASKMQRTEELMRIAKIGHYGDIEALIMLW